MVSNFDQIKKLFKNQEQNDFFLKCLSFSLDALKNFEYSKFDAHTQTNCCHGTALFLADLIKKILDSKILEKTIFYKSIHDFSEDLLILTFFYIATYASEIVPFRGRKSKSLKLKKISSCGTAFFRDLLFEVQKAISELVVKNYWNLYQGDIKGLSISGISLATWKKYTNLYYCRKNFRGLIYTSSMCSMQISLFSIIQNKQHLLIIRDRLDNCLNFIEREEYLYVGDGSKKFIQLDCPISKQIPNSEVIFVYSGFSINGVRKTEFYKFLSDIPNLIFFCDVFYPDFPKIKSDPSFDSTRIIPSEKEFFEKIERCLLHKGFSKESSEYFCLSHVFLCSKKEAAQSMFFENSAHYTPNDAY